MSSSTSRLDPSIVSSLLHDAEQLENQLAAERFASIVCGLYDAGPRAVPRGRSLALRDGIVRAVAARGTPTALGLLRALGAVAAAPVGPAAATAALRLEREGVVAPHWAPTKDAVRCVGAARWWDEGGDTSAGLLLGFAHADASQHTLLIFVDAALGGIAKHVGVVKDLAEVQAALADTERGSCRVQSAEPVAVAGEIRRAIAVTSLSRESTALAGEGYRTHRAFAMARVRAVESGHASQAARAA